MKTIGLLGGMSWESTVTYYQAINQGVKSQLGGLHSAKLVLASLNFAEIEQLQHQGDWATTAVILSDAARAVERAGAQGLLICTNTMHKVADQVQAAINIPLLHIADATAGVLVCDGVRRVGLLGTAFTMEQDFYVGRLQAAGLDVIIPHAKQRILVHQVIYEELCQGRIRDASRAAYLSVISDLQARGAEAVILGCTEIGLLVNQADTALSLYDTTAIHAHAAVDFMLDGGSDAE
ncbi:aspartate racemase [Arenicella chitinivorans]|uniref:Aspartate racemase n=1 Tax=Arenicella chitinivorans TaxID=1329800 RepID=A0A918RHG8_9GAMM|nr:aspartate/glutamate racemase family protein [Arenicella chitinivorans]GGZ97083.1 aspartate racemase [Arenicella chitinivorans]